MSHFPPPPASPVGIALVVTATAVAREAKRRTNARVEAEEVCRKVVVSHSHLPSGQWLTNSSASTAE